jgi:hypothetical protein
MSVQFDEILGPHAGHLVGGVFVISSSTASTAAPACSNASWSSKWVIASKRAQAALWALQEAKTGSGARGGAHESLFSATNSEHRL